jgi:hypothetical protein
MTFVTPNLVFCIVYICKYTLFVIFYLLEITHFVWCGRISPTFDLIMKAKRTSETSVTYYHTARLNILEYNQTILYALTSENKTNNLLTAKLIHTPLNSSHLLLDSHKCNAHAQSKKLNCTLNEHRKGF